MTTANQFHQALTKADLEYSGLSWSGFNIFGDHASIEEVKRLQHLAGTVPQLRAEIARLRGRHDDAALMLDPHS